MTPPAEIRQIRAQLLRRTPDNRIDLTKSQTCALVWYPTSVTIHASVRAFRGLRYVPDRVDYGAVTAPAPPKDPRHALRLLDAEAKEGDGTDAEKRRARFKLAEWRRAGVLVRDERPSLYAVRRKSDEGEVLGVFAALAVDGAGDDDTSADAAPFVDIGVAVSPVVASFAEARVKRTLENAVDREADASWTIDKVSYELWCIDEESAVARVSTLLSSAPLEIESGAGVFASQRAWWRRARPSADDDRPLAGAHALAFLHSGDEPWPDVPVGAALAPLVGTLDP